MKRFKYSLESVLNYRESEQEQARHRLAEAERMVREETKELQKTREAMAKSRAEQNKRSSIEFLILRERYLARLRNEEKNQLARLQALQQEEDKARGALLEASQEVLKMEKVKARELKAWEVANRREEQSLLDEAGNTARFRVAGLM